VGLKLLALLLSMTDIHFIYSLISSNYSVIIHTDWSVP
jgi:hypothetical protein